MVQKKYKMRILYSKFTINRRVKQIADKISKDYQGKEVIFICVLKGAYIFFADLTRYLTFHHMIDFVRLASYESGTVSSGNINITKDIEVSIEGKNVIIVEDIIDSGRTLAFLQQRLKKENPKSLKTCALIFKRKRMQISIDVDYVGFWLDDGFVVGYGLDCDEKYRYLPDIYVIEE